MMTRNISEEVRRLGEKNKRLTDIIKNVAQINVALLHLCVNVQDHPDAKVELDRLACLVNAIRFELKDEMKFDIGHETNSELPQYEQDEHSDCNNSPLQAEEKEEGDLAVKLENIVGKELSEGKTLVLRISPSKSARKRKSRFKSEKEEFAAKKKKRKSPDSVCIEEEKSKEVNDNSCDHSQAPVDSKLFAQDILSTIKQHEAVLNNRLQRKRKRVNEKEGLTTPQTSKQGPCMCERCGKMFKSKATLRCHIKLHKEKDANLSYNCNVCGKKFNLKTTLQSHMKFHSSDKEFQCTYCGKCFIRRHILNLHIRTHNGEKPHVCSVCSKSFSLSCNLRRHSIIHTGERPWTCVQCGKSFNQSCILKAHMRIHSQEKTLKCTLCDKLFSQTRHLYSHSIRVHSKDIRQHPNTKIHECQFCQKQFPHQKELTHHIRTHTGECPFQCDQCFKGFQKKVQLEEHARTHTGFKPFKCTLCDKAFIRRSALHLHKNVHNGTVYSCSVCNRTFNNPANMTRHIRNHSGEKPFKCQVCNRAFSQKVSLETHMWTHTLEKRFKCSICGKGYNDKRNLISHTKTHNSLNAHPSSLPPPSQTLNTEQNTPLAFVSMASNLPVIAYDQSITQNTMSLTTHDGSMVAMTMPPFNQNISIVAHNDQGPTLTPL